jgi:hypothetical protein
MPGKWSNLEDFFAPPASLTLERILVVDYLISNGFLPRDLDDLPPEQAAALFAEACCFARRNLGKFETLVVLSAYVPVGFSQN